MTPLLLFAALGCSGDDPDPEETGTSSALDSGAADTQVDSADTLPDSGDTAETATETGDTGTVWVDPGTLGVSPLELVVDPGASWTLRAVHTLDGRRQDVAVAWSSSDEAVVGVSAEGVATAIGAGEATLSASYETLSATSAVTVQASPTLRVQLVQAEDGAPLTAGSVLCNGVTVAVDGTTGVAVFDEVPAGETLWLTGWAEDASRIPGTLMEVAGRDVVLPLRTRDQHKPDSDIDGTFDFGALPPLSDDEKAAGYVIMGIASATLRWGPLFWRADEVLAPNRDVTLYGFDVRVPGNLAVLDEVEDWTTPSWSGDVGVWSLAGPVPLADAVLGLADLSSALDFLLENVDGFLFGYEGALVVPEDAALEMEVRPTTSLSEVVEVEFPAWPEPFTEADAAMIVITDGDAPEGPAVVGFGRGFTGTAHSTRVPGSFYGWDGSTSQAVGYLEVGGVGTLGAKVLSAAPIVDGVAVLPDFLDAPSLPAWDGELLQAEVSVDPDAHIVHLYVRTKKKDERDYYFPPTTGVITLPSEGPDFDWAKVSLELAEVQTASGTYESMLQDGRYRRHDLQEVGRATGFVTEKMY